MKPNLPTSLALLPILFGLAAAQTSPEITFPEDYQSWRHVKSVVFGPDHKSFATEGGKIFHFYANSQAVEGYRTGNFRMDRSWYAKRFAARRARAIPRASLPKGNAPRWMS